MLTTEQRLKKLTDRLERLSSQLDRIVAELSTTTQRTNKYYNQKRLEISKTYAEINLTYSAWVNINYPIEYKIYLAGYAKKVNGYTRLNNNVKVSTMANRDINKQMVNSVKEDAIQVFLQSSEAGKKKLNRLTAVTQNINISDYRISQVIGETSEQITNLNKTTKILRDQLLDASLDGKYILVIDKNGVQRNYKIKAYAELVSKTELTNLQSTAAVSTAYEAGTDLIQVSSHNTTTPICQEFEGKIFSLTGQNKDFPVAEALPAYHPNCKHRITPVFEEILRLDGTYNKFVDFSRGATIKHPTRKSFILIKDR